jgi:hypothetical protein
VALKNDLLNHMQTLEEQNKTAKIKVKKPKILNKKKCVNSPKESISIQDKSQNSTWKEKENSSNERIIFLETNDNTNQKPKSETKINSNKINLTMANNQTNTGTQDNVPMFTPPPFAAHPQTFYEVPCSGAFDNRGHLRQLVYPHFPIFTHSNAQFMQNPSFGVYQNGINGGMGYPKGRSFSSGYFPLLNKNNLMNQRYDINNPRRFNMQKSSQFIENSLKNKSLDGSPYNYELHMRQKCKKNGIDTKSNKSLNKNKKESDINYDLFNKIPKNRSGELNKKFVKEDFVNEAITKFKSVYFNSSTNEEFRLNIRKTLKLLSNELDHTLDD